VIKFRERILGLASVYINFNKGKNSVCDTRVQIDRLLLALRQ